MLVTVDPGASEPLAEQIARQVRAAFADGELQPGERLPPARELARALDVNMHTVLRAYQALRTEGLVELRQGRGATIRRDAQPGRQRLRELLAEVRRVAAREGLTTADVKRLLEET